MFINVTFIFFALSLLETSSGGVTNNKTGISSCDQIILAIKVVWKFQAQDWIASEGNESRTKIIRLIITVNPGKFTEVDFFNKEVWISIPSEEIKRQVGEIVETSEQDEILNVLSPAHTDVTTGSESVWAPDKSRDQQSHCVTEVICRTLIKPCQEIDMTKIRGNTPFPLYGYRDDDPHFLKTIKGAMKVKIIQTGEQASGRKSEILALANIFECNLSKGLLIDRATTENWIVQNLLSAVFPEKEQFTYPSPYKKSSETLREPSQYFFKLEARAVRIVGTL